MQRTFTIKASGPKDCFRCEPEVIHQEDIFFNTPDGRLKLRVFSPTSGQLIYYHRPDQKGPKVSNYELSPSNDPEGLKSTLTEALGIRATIKKTRYLYISGRTRIHFDQVESLGAFIELEVVLSETESPEDGEKEAQEVNGSFGHPPRRSHRWLLCRLIGARKPINLDRSGLIADLDLVVTHTPQTPPCDFQQPGCMGWKSKGIHPTAEILKAPTHVHEILDGIF